MRVSGFVGLVVLVSVSFLACSKERSAKKWPPDGAVPAATPAPNQTPEQTPAPGGKEADLGGQIKAVSIVCKNTLTMLDGRTGRSASKSFETSGQVLKIESTKVLRGRGNITFNKESIDYRLTYKTASESIEPKSRRVRNIAMSSDLTLQVTRRGQTSESKTALNMNLPGKPTAKAKIVISNQGEFLDVECRLVAAE